MNQLATDIYTLRLSENSAVPEMPSTEGKALFDLLWFLNMPVKDLARLIEDLPMSDWPLIQSDDPLEYLQSDRN